MYPTAYIEIPKGHPYYKKNYDEIDIEVHGGLTFNDSALYISNDGKIEGWFIGWDYSHFGDYTGDNELIPIYYRADGKKWTTEKIIDEVKDVVKQLGEVEENRYEI